ncbi:hypothetical protein EC988_007113, partial [Linderina pennispora]
MSSSPDTSQSLSLYRAAISSPATDSRTKAACLAKICSVLDNDPAIRSFDTTRPKNKRTVTSLQLWRLLVDRATAYKDTAESWRQFGDAQSAIFNAERSVVLFESMLEANAGEGIGRAERVVAIDTLLLALGDWIVLE